MENELIKLIQRVLKNKSNKPVTIYTDDYIFSVTRDNIYIMNPLLYLTHANMSPVNFSYTHVNKEYILQLDDIKKIEF